jgi:hypothetical protein
MISDFESLLSEIGEQIDIEARPDVYLQQFASFDQDLAYLYVIHEAARWIAGDGFYFLMSTKKGQVIPEMIEGLKRFGMPQVSEVVAQIAARVAVPFPRGWFLRDKRLVEALERVSEDKILGDLRMTRVDAEENPRWFEDMKREELFDDLETNYFKLIETENGGLDAVRTRILEQQKRRTQSDAPR